ncbi:gas vesicle protein [Dactylosporangium sp. NPDC005555]|uniref:gas vesicle protein n=1 Tax=Dactylosporangium sp. NPDC005555 TaxID=3154889 RepID=UPI0033BAAF58
MTQASHSGAMFGPSSANPATSGHEPANLGDILERVLDRGIVIVGDIRVSLLDIELLTLKLRLVVASVDTARQMGIDWWEHDPWLTSRARGELPAGTAGAEALEAKAGAEAIEAGAEAVESGIEAEERRAGRSPQPASRRGDTHPVHRQVQRG